MADEEQLPLEVKELIRERIKSIEALEVLVALRTQQSRAVPFDELAALTRLAPQAVATAVDELAQVGLVAIEAARAARYRAATPELDQSVERLADTYAEFRVETLVFIANDAIGRVRKSALHTFAEAFKLQGRKK